MLPRTARSARGSSPSARCSCTGPRSASAGRRCSAEAVVMARAAGDSSTLLYTLAARRAALWGPDAVDETARRQRRRSGGWRSAVVTANGAWVGLGWRLTDLLVMGDRTAVDAAVDTMVRWAVRAAPADAPVVHDPLPGDRSPCSTALPRGRGSDLHRARVQYPGARPERQPGLAAIQTYALRNKQDRLEEIEPVVTAQPSSPSAVPCWRAALARSPCAGGPGADAAGEFERLAEGDSAGCRATAFG